MKKWIMLVVIILFSFICVGMLSTAVNTGNQRTNFVGTSISAADNKAVKASYMKLPLSFIKNEGQKDKSILFYEQGSGHMTVFTNKGIVHSLGSGKGDIITLTPLNASPFTVEALDMKGGKVNYFAGNDPKNWKTNIPTYGAILYKGIYPGIDMKVYGTNNQLEYDLIVAPGADPSQICLSYTGAKKLSLTKQGDLAIALKEGSILQKKPVLYQTINNTRKDIKGRFVLADATTYRFEVGSYDARHPLVIDPVLVYSTYLGGGSDDIVWAIAVDSSGNAYVAGDTDSTNFPTQSPYQGAYAGGSYDAFVTKFNPTGNALVYSTYLGGGGYDRAYSIAVDSSGNAYVAGYTSSNNFPTQSPYQGALKGYYDAFVTKLNPSGSALVYSTYLGGDYGSDAYAIAVDSSGNAYVAGYTCSYDFPTKNPYQGTRASYCDAFVTTFNPSGSALVYSTYLGGNGDDKAYAIAVDSTGNAYVTGTTSSLNFPTKSPYHGTNAGNWDAFITKLNPSGSALVYSTYLGGSGYDVSHAISVDTSGNVYVAGETNSTNFPTQSPYQGTFAGGGSDAFVAKFNPSGSALLYSTYLGGSGDDYARAIAVDSQGSSHVAGETNSTNFPIKSSYHETIGRYSDAFITKLNPLGNALVYSTYLGGNGYDYAYAIAIDSSGNAYVAGDTTSINFPTQSPYQGSRAGLYDVFVTKFYATTEADLYANFTGSGLYKYSGSSWSKINTSVASSMTASATDLYANFTGYGLYKWNGTIWIRINTLIPDLMTASYADLYASFTGYGIYKYNGTAWSRIHTSVPALMAASGTDLYASFTGNGIYKYDGTAWSRIHTSVPALMAASYTDLYTSFTGNGLYKYNGTDWKMINALVPALMAATATDLYASFMGYGVYKYNRITWTRINTTMPTSMAATATDLYANYTGYGIYKYNDTSWSRINTSVSSGMVGSR